MSTRYYDSSVSVQGLVPVWGNLRKQVKSQGDGRNQNQLYKVARGMPV